LSTQPTWSLWSGPEPGSRRASWSNAPDQSGGDQQVAGHANAPVLTVAHVLVKVLQARVADENASASCRIHPFPFDAWVRQGCIGHWGRSRADAKEHSDEGHGSGQGDGAVRGRRVRYRRGVRGDGPVQRAARPGGRLAGRRRSPADQQGQAGRLRHRRQHHGDRRPVRRDQGTGRRLRDLGGRLDGGGRRVGQALAVARQRGRTAKGLDAADFAESFGAEIAAAEQQLRTEPAANQE
jgi:hypothetical protein